MRAWWVATLALAPRLSHRGDWTMAVCLWWALWTVEPTDPRLHSLLFLTMTLENALALARFQDRAHCEARTLRQHGVSHTELDRARKALAVSRCALSCTAGGWFAVLVAGASLDAARMSVQRATVTAVLGGVLSAGWLLRRPWPPPYGAAAPPEAEDSRSTNNTSRSRSNKRKE